MKLKEKAKILVDEFRVYAYDIGVNDNSFSKECAIIAVKNEYNSNRQLLLNLESGLEISERIYLYRI
jgi:hypothetical protein